MPRARFGVVGASFSMLLVSRKAFNIFSHRSSSISSASLQTAVTFLASSPK